MGLDMYLEKKTYIGNQYRDKSEQVKLTKNKAVKNIKTERISEVVENVMYWRKANAIHNWFIQNCAEGDESITKIIVGYEDLKKLLETCKKVLKGSKLINGKINNGYGVDKDLNKVYNVEDGKIIKDNTLAKELLPTCEGFFFGSTDYDEYYYNDILRTKNTLEEILKEEDAEFQDYEYVASW